MRRDLFDESTGGYAQDARLLDRMVTDKLSTLRRNGPRRGLELGRDARAIRLRDRPLSPPHRRGGIALPEDEAAELTRLPTEHESCSKPNTTRTARTMPL